MAISSPVKLQEVYDYAVSFGYTGTLTLSDLIAWSGWTNLPAGASKLSDFFGVSAESWVQVGNALSFSAPGRGGFDSMTASQVALINSNTGNRNLITYSFNGTNWSQVGNAFYHGYVGFPDLCTLSSSRVAVVYGNGKAELITYDFDGTDWAQVGNTLSISGLDQPSVVSLSASRVAVVDTGTPGSIRTYDFDGTNWAQVGNKLDIAGTMHLNYACYLSSTRIAIMNNSVGSWPELRAYDFDGTDWAQVGTGITHDHDDPSLSWLGGNRVAVYSTNTDLQVFEFDGTNWQAGIRKNITPESVAAISGRYGDNQVVVLDTRLDTIRLYELQ